MLILFFIIGILSACISGFFTFRALKHLTEKGKRDKLFIFVFMSSPRSMLEPYFDADGMFYLYKARMTGYVTVIVLIIFGLSAIFGK
jgi:hypothetical protein